MKEGFILIENGEYLAIKKGTAITSKQVQDGNIPVIAGGTKQAYYHNISNRDGNIICISSSGSAGFVSYWKNPIFASDCFTIQSKDENTIITKYVYIFLKSKQKEIMALKHGVGIGHVYDYDITNNFQLPLPPLQIQQQIVEKFDEIEKKQQENRRKIDGNDGEILSQIQGIKNVENVKIGDIFECKIGKRVLDKNLLKEGKYKVYSANVFEPFSYLNEPLITDFSKSSILFGIDGDWMVNYIEKDIKFYPTDHCGYLRAKNDEFITKVFTKFIEIAGKEAGFSRQKRASIDRVQQIKIPLPPLQTQHQPLQQISQIEKENEELQMENEVIEQQKKEFLDKYLK